MPRVLSNDWQTVSIGARVYILVVSRLTAIHASVFSKFLIQSDPKTLFQSTKGGSRKT